VKPPVVILREVRRGGEPHELHLVAADGRVTILLGYGLTPDERVRSRETALALLTDTLAARPLEGARA
jgi:hypothetical protein